uniref:WIYLD domain-containing protein n=1 Tax=Oryza glumipatula TaxID=40148 RepID=A0A0E0AZH8_9ORYZ
MPPRRPKKGARRIDAAIDHFTPMGYAVAHIRSVVMDLLKVYGDDWWPFLEEGAYRVVQEALFDKEEQLQLQLLQQEEEQEQEHQQPQQLDGAMEDTPIENSMPIVEMHEVPAEAEPTVEEMQEALFQKQKEEQLQLQLRMCLPFYQFTMTSDATSFLQLEGAMHEVLESAKDQTSHEITW